MSRHPIVIQEWEESERGWGVRPDGFTMHKTMSDRDAFVKAYHAKHNNLSEAPDEYTRTSGNPYVKDVNQKTYDAIAKSTLGMWGKGNRPDASIFQEEPADSPESIVSLMFHDDDCDELLTSDGLCPNCNFHPDMQSTGFKNVPSSILLRREGRSFLGVGRKPFSQPKISKKRDTMTDESSPSSTATVAVEKINGGVLTRAPKTQNCNCNFPDMKANAIENGDEWTCSCGQGWRAKIMKELPPGNRDGALAANYKAPFWRRIATKRATKPKPATPPETE